MLPISWPVRSYRSPCMAILLARRFASLAGCRRAQISATRSPLHLWNPGGGPSTDSVVADPLTARGRRPGAARPPIMEEPDARETIAIRVRAHGGPDDRLD